MTENAERDAGIEDLAYLITAKRFQERGLRGAIGEPDLAIARPLATFLHAEGYRKVVVDDAMVERAARLFYESQTGNDNWATSLYASQWANLTRRILTAALTPDEQEKGRA